MTKQFSVLSLFTGVGGLDYGFEAAGFNTRVAVEWDHQCCESLRTSRDWPVIEGDLLETPTQEILKKGGLQAGSVDMLIGGPPCQPFSKSGWWKSGDSLRLDDPRASTLSGYLRVLEDARPHAFLLENVEGLAFGGKDEGLKLLLAAIQRINKVTKTNYSPVVITLNAADFGVPQTRTRVFIIGSRDGKKFVPPTPTHHDPEIPSQAKEPWMTAWDAIGELKGSEEENLQLTGKWADLLPSIPEGMNYLWHTERMGGEPLFGWRRRYWNFLLKLAKNRPAWTIQAQPGPATGPFHWKNRRLSGDELARLQTFPRDLKITGSRIEVQRQIGNAVPSLLAEVLAREIRHQFFDDPLASPLTLKVNRSKKCPSPEPVCAVPAKYLTLAGDHIAHPGTGKGYLYQPFEEA
ncbi:DNA cytosine methyltransferase [Pseudomonas aeruginosa]|nr:DNA (cytosine-5-)-methyltransferase [Pseudomonas aeruginosa]EKV4467483.1 DNA (cytosine-5-)-methyltransferase [Pseudomonas aeruginosa]ELQ7869614.1 DNA (cytosine-5-)-methyltransferase [Pseudomonas aeruginosa]MBH8938571.1 DNA (cytosine-5-)-methyltransferase [Pseudomonas aeruginosa]MDD1813163.1 DNA cytosine methyltransferase [Pseudomonas aeruginosa]MDQ6228433.1 DNA cytosine methyltransferase [Pseudomonas aeruginosa]